MKYNNKSVAYIDDVPLDDTVELIDDDIELDPVNISKDDSIAIMGTYNEGKNILNAAKDIIAVIGGVENTNKLNEKSIREIGTKVKSSKELAIYTQEYDKALKNYEIGKMMMNNAKEQMIDKLQQFIYYVIERRFNTFKKYSKDLFQEGVIGILKGIDSYNPQKGKPTTYFYIYILHEMTEFINENINKTTSHYAANIVKVKKAIGKFEHAGREWNVKDIAQETGISAETIIQSIKIMECSDELHYDSYDSPEYLDNKMSQNYLSPEEEYLKNEATETILKAIDNLPEDERNVIKLKYGFDGGNGMSYKNIANALGIQIDKAKKLNSSALRHLRNSKALGQNFKNLIKEDRAINSKKLGVVPITIGESIMEDIDQIPIDEL